MIAIANISLQPITLLARIANQSDNMGLITSRFNIDGLHSNGGRRSHQDEEQLYNNSLYKNFFTNFFFMGGERFEMNDREYLFGEPYDLTFLSCTEPYSLPYKKAQQTLLTSLNVKQKSGNKVSNRVGSLSSPLNILTGRHRQVSQSCKQDAQTQTLNGNKNIANGLEPAQPLIVLINIRKETLRLVKSSHVCNLDNDQSSLTNTASISNATSEQSSIERATIQKATDGQDNHQLMTLPNHRRQQKSGKTNRHSTTSSHATTLHLQDSGEEIELAETVYSSKNYQDQSDSSSITSNTLSSARSISASSSTGKSGYTSVRDVPPSECASDDGEYFEDALNEPTNLLSDNDAARHQRNSSLRQMESRKDTCDFKVTIEDGGEPSACDIVPKLSVAGNRDTLGGGQTMPPDESSENRCAKILKRARKDKSSKSTTDMKPQAANHQPTNRVYNIEFMFDSEVDCSIRVSYFCTRVVSSNNVTFKPLHATYKSKTYTYKRGLNQKFEQQDHAFRPYLFNEDLLIYKPLDPNGNFNSGTVYPIVIHCVALEGPMPRQSQSLVATVEKSQLDDSYSIKPLKQMISVDGVQYILQDIYGIENKPLNVAQTPRKQPKLTRNLRSSCGSLYSLTNIGNSSMNLSDTASIGSVLNDNGDGLAGSRNRGSIISNQYRSLGSENTFECVICMSEERDTMLLPCRHMCLCSSCAQSLRHQSDACPICRCPFKAALNLKFTQRSEAERKWSSSVAAGEIPEHNCSTVAARSTSYKHESELTNATRRDSLTTSATPLLDRPKIIESDKRSSDRPKKGSHDTSAAVDAATPVGLSCDGRGSLEGSAEAHTSTKNGGFVKSDTGVLEMKSMFRSSLGSTSHKADRVGLPTTEGVTTGQTQVAENIGNDKCSPQEKVPK